MKLPKWKFWNFGGLFFFYFLMWAVVLAFLSIWLKEEAGLDATQTGLVFSAISLIALCYQPFFGVISDKLGFRKNLFWFVVIMALLMGPFFTWLFIPLLQFNIWVGAIIGGIYLSAVFQGGVGVVEAYIERASRASSIEYGRVRLFGSVAGAVATLVGGRLYVMNPTSIFWFASCSAALLAILLKVAKVDEAPKTAEALAAQQAGAEVEKKEDGITKERVFSIFKLKNFWFLALLMIGTASVHDVFDQQFPNYYNQFFPTTDQGTARFSELVSLQTALEAIIMIFMPFLINKIGAKNGLLLFGLLTFIRIGGSAVADDVFSLSAIRLIAAVEMPLLLISIFKYITGVFDVRLTATIYLLAFNFAKQAANVIFSSVAGSLYTSIGFQNTYYVFSVVVLIITVICFFGLSNDKTQGGLLKKAGGLKKGAPALGASDISR
ncbi:oligosaccharide MFS transporter [Saccharibacillus kuerlensis]|uniref:MFS transporter n=1 Tax=Saccharibacillus kuerlensis TaxID=459527 RepID=A0ABQ2KWM5_9BACL|nr:oligosaccharide MFS transporter [Saccharibacillus kuerlensis]GGN95454.1 MFS transporter [Saccharibacillus kuerlensis]